MRCEGSGHVPGLQTAGMHVQPPVDATATCRRALPAYVCPVARPGRSAAQPMEDLASRAQPAWPLAPMETVLVRHPAAPAVVLLPSLNASVPSAYCQRSTFSHHNSRFAVKAQYLSLMHAESPMSTPPPDAMDDGCGGFGEPGCSVPLSSIAARSVCRCPCHMTVCERNRDPFMRLNVPAHVCTA